MQNTIFHGLVVTHHISKLSTLHQIGLLTRDYEFWTSKTVTCFIHWSYNNLRWAWSYSQRDNATHYALWESVMHCNIHVVTHHVSRLDDIGVTGGMLQGCRLLWPLITQLYGQAPVSWCSLACFLLAHKWHKYCHVHKCSLWFKIVLYLPQNVCM